MNVLGENPNSWRKGLIAAKVSSSQRQESHDGRGEEIVQVAKERRGAQVCKNTKRNPNFCFLIIKSNLLSFKKRQRMLLALPCRLSPLDRHC